MKKVISILLAAIMITSLCSCSSLRQRGTYTSSETQSTNLTPEKSAHLTIWAADDQKAWVSKVIAQFKSKYGIDVAIQNVDDYNVVSKIQNDGPAGIGPDLFMCPHDSMGTLVSSGLVRENNVTADKIKTEDVSAAYNAAVYNGKVYGYPMSLTTYIMMYNKKLVSNPATKFSDLKQFATTFNNPSENKYALMFPVTETFYVTSFIQGYNGYIFGKNGKDGSDIGLNKANAIKGLKFFQSLKQSSPVSSQNADLQTVEGLFGQGKVAYEIAQIWAVQSAQKQGIDIGVEPLPTMDNGKRPVPCATVEEMFVSTFSKYPKAAKLFAQMATSDDMMLSKVKMQSLIPVSKSLLNSSYVKNDKLLSAFTVSASNCIPSPNISEMSYVWDPYLRAVKSIWDNNSDPQSEMNTCINTIKQQIANNK